MHHFLMCENAQYICTYDFVIITADIDECREGYNCSQHCNNTIGSYLCYCDDGFTLNATDGHTCDGMYNRQCIDDIRFIVLLF